MNYLNKIEVSLKAVDPKIKVVRIYDGGKNYLVEVSADTNEINYEFPYFLIPKFGGAAKVFYPLDDPDFFSEIVPDKLIANYA